MSGRVWRLLLLLQCCAGAVWQQVEATSLSARLARLRFATGTFEGRHPLRAAAGRSWARHVRSWVVTTAGAQADDDPTPVRLDRPPWDPSELNTWWRVPPSTGFKHRNGVALRLGNASEPDGYDWVLYGDDDTVFLVDNALALLAPLDPAVPFLITDATGNGCFLPAHDGAGGKATSFCSLPGTPESFVRSASGGECVMHPAVAPCAREAFGDGCPERPSGRLFAWGGAGFLVSRGFVHAIPAEVWNECEGRSGESDAIFIACAWQNGFGVTNPSFAPENAAGAARSTTGRVDHNATGENSRYQVDGRGRCLFGGYSANRYHEVVAAARGVLDGGACASPDCAHLLFRTVGVHLALGHAAGGTTDAAAVALSAARVEAAHADYLLAKAVLADRQRGAAV